jgi:hypothetical protein
MGQPLMTTSKLLGVGKTKSKTHIEIRNHLTRSTYLHKTLRSIPPRNSGKTTRIRDRGSPAELDGLITATEFGQVPVRIGGQLTDDGRVHRAAAAASLARDTAGGQNVRQGEKSVYGFSLLCFLSLSIAQANIRPNFFMKLAANWSSAQEPKRAHVLL